MLSSNSLPASHAATSLSCLCRDALRVTAALAMEKVMPWSNSPDKNAGCRRPACLFSVLRDGHGMVILENSLEIILNPWTGSALSVPLLRIAEF